MKGRAEAAIREQLAEIRTVLAEEKQLAIRRKRDEEIGEAMRQLESAILKLESDERAQMIAIQDRLHIRKQEAALLGDYEQEKRRWMRQSAKLKKLKKEMVEVTEKGIQLNMLIKHREEELNWLKGHPEPYRVHERVTLRVAELEHSVMENRPELETLRQTYLKLENEIRSLSAAEKEVWRLEKSIAECKKARRDCDELTEELERLKAHVSRRYYAKREIQAMADLRQKKEANAYDSNLHERLLHRIYHFLENELAPLLEADALKTGA